MKISCWTLFIMLSFCGAKIVFFTVKQTKFQFVFEEVPHSGQWRQSPTASATLSQIFKETMFRRFKVQFFPWSIVQFVLYFLYPCI